MKCPSVSATTWASRASGPPPVVGSPQDQADKAASARYVALEDGDRWLLANQIGRTS